MPARILKRASSAGIVVLAPALLGGCFGIADRSVANADAVEIEAPAPRVATAPPITVVKGGVKRVADAADASAGGNPLPEPSEIFDFHPPGSKPDAWREPFVIDPNDGPLAGYRQRMEAELKADSNSQASAVTRPARKTVCPSDGPAGAISDRCGENDAAKRLAQ